MSHNTYTIEKISDIYKLPTVETIEQCLKELRTCLLQTRELNDNLVDSLELSDPFPIKWLDNFVWINDGEENTTWTILPK